MVGENDHDSCNDPSGPHARPQQLQQRFTSTTTTTAAHVRPLPPLQLHLMTFHTYARPPTTLCADRPSQVLQRPSQVLQVLQC